MQSKTSNIWLLTRITGFYQGLSHAQYPGLNYPPWRRKNKPYTRIMDSLSSACLVKPKSERGQPQALMPYHLTIGNHQPRKLYGEGTAPSKVFFANCAVQCQSSASPFFLKFFHSGEHPIRPVPWQLSSGPNLSTGFLSCLWQPLLAF